MEKKKINLFEILKWALATIIALLFGVFGMVYHDTGSYNEVLLIIILVILVVALIFSTVLSLVGKKRYLSGLEKQENLQNKLLEQRKRASEIAKEKIFLLRKLIRLIDLCSVAVLISVCAIEFCFFALTGKEAAGAAFPFIFGAYVGLYFIRPRRIRINENKSEDYLAESEYPLIYAVAHRAARAIGCDGRIKLFVDHDFNAGILTISDGYSIRLGSYLLDNTSEEELYNILLHEFSHVERKNDEINDLIVYANLVQEDETVELGILPYIYLHARFAFEFLSYQYVCSLMNEDAADSAMLRHGNPEVAASMLIKLKFSELYQWERGTYDEETLFESESLSEDCIHKPLRFFKERMELRAEEWIKMIDSEILSRNSTHSTAKMRIEGLGVKELKLVERNDTPEYLAEVEKAVLHIEKLLYKTLLPEYETVRKMNYVEPKKIVDEWEQAGKPITRENYQDIVVALFTLNRIEEFVNLCCQVIENIPEPANYFAHHMYGIYLLRTYDERGIDHLYKSIELNHNNWAEAMQTIGEYACIVGKQDELDKYRERALELTKKEINVYDKMNSLSGKDKLVEEKLPEGMLSDFLAYVSSVDEERIDKIYMVRKVIDDENFVTCVIVQPRKKVSSESFGEVMDKIFQYLDKSSDWQFSLFDIRFLAGVNPGRINNSLVYNATKK